uniref:Uncharacterized protein n=1 Tax=Trichuris muris TaxID=70415 RepID=A0A5S6QHF3_TRIMR
MYALLTILAALAVAVTGKGKPSSITTNPSQSGKTPAVLVSLQRLYHLPLTKNILETSQARIKQEIAAGATAVGPIGKVPIAPDSNCQFLKPIVTFTKADGPNTNLYAIDENSKQWALANGYTQGNTIGYAVPKWGICGASIPVYNFYHVVVGFVQMSSMEEGGSYLPPNPGGVFYPRGVGFFIWE